MLEHKESIPYWYLLFFSLSRKLTKYIEKGSKSFSYLIIPEDTSTTVAQHRAVMLNKGKPAYCGLIKLVFWAIAAISVSLLIGQLG